MAEQLYKVGEEAIWADRDVKGMVIAVEEIDGRYMYTFVWQGHFEYGVGAHQLKKLPQKTLITQDAAEETGDNNPPTPPKTSGMPPIPTFSYEDDLAELEARAAAEALDIPTFPYAGNSSDDCSLDELEARAAAERDTANAPPTPPKTSGMPPIPRIPYEEDMKEIRRLLAEAADRPGDVRQIIPVTAPTSVVLEVGGMEIVIESETAVIVRVNEV